LVNHITETRYLSQSYADRQKDLRWLNQLNQAKDDYPTNLNLLKEKAIRSNFNLNLKNDILAIASKWERRVSPKM